MPLVEEIPNGNCTSKMLYLVLQRRPRAKW